jgi:hypothetical protein
MVCPVETTTQFGGASHCFHTEVVQPLVRTGQARPASFSAAPLVTIFKTNTTPCGVIHIHLRATPSLHLIRGVVKVVGYREFEILRKQPFNCPSYTSIYGVVLRRYKQATKAFQGRELYLRPSETHLIRTTANSKLQHHLQRTETKSENQS